MNNNNLKKLGNIFAQRASSLKRLNVGPININSGTTSEGYKKLFLRALKSKDMEEISKITKAFYQNVSFEDAYFFNLPPLNEEHGFLRPLEVVISSAQTEDEALLHHLAKSL